MHACRRSSGDPRKVRFSSAGQEDAAAGCWLVLSGTDPPCPPPALGRSSAAGVPRPLTCSSVRLAGTFRVLRSAAAW